MSLERKTTALEFETMLRHHLRKGGAPVSACSGFDPDRASAYLEGVLGDHAQERYEAHLSGCPACRRHIIELSRLSQLAFQPEARPATSTRWSNWKSSLAAMIGQRLDSTAWHLNWRLAGAVLASCAVLFYLSIARPWRRSVMVGSQVSIASSNQAPSIIANQAKAASNQESKSLPENVGGAQADVPKDAFADASTRNLIAQNAQKLDAAATSPSIGNRPEGMPRERAEQAIPEPRVTISANDAQAKSQQGIGGVISGIGADEAKLSEKAAASASSIEPASPPPTRARKSAPQAAAEFIPTTKQPELETGSVFAADTGVMRSELRNDQTTLPMLMPRMAPNPEDNPMQSGLLRGDRRPPKAKTERGFLQNQKNSILAHVMDYMKGYVPWLRTPGNFDRSLVIGRDAEKDKDDTDENDGAGKGEYERSNKLIKYFRGKTFRFIRGYWIDDKFDSEMSAWRITLLRRGSEQYNRVLAEEPQLAEFFDFGPIIIVWQDKIYRVTGK
jgi:putative zinc finger protein